MKTLKKVQQWEKTATNVWTKVVAGVFLMMFVVFMGSTVQVHATTENWSENDNGTYCYTDENGWQYEFATKEADRYKLIWIPEDAKGEIIIASELTVDGMVRKLEGIDQANVRIPAGVTKATFGQGIIYFSGVLFEQCSPDLVVSCYLEQHGILYNFIKQKGFKMEYENGCTDQDGVIYYVTYKENEDGTKGDLVAAVYGYEGKKEKVTVQSKVTIQGVNYTITEVANSAFACKSVKSVTFPDTITKFGSYVFEACESLENVKLPKKLKNLGSGTFAGCKSLTSVQVPSGVTELYTEVFSGCSNLKKVVLAKKTKHIGDYVFCDCEKLTTIKNLDNVETIGSEAFCRCKKLTSLTFGKKLSSIGAGAFFGCSALKSITIQSKSMDYIGTQVFDGTKNLKTLVLKATNLTSEKLCSDTFKGCRNKMVVKVPAKKVKAYSKWMKKCGNSTIVVKKG